MSIQTVVQWNLGSRLGPERILQVPSQGVQTFNTAALGSHRRFLSRGGPYVDLCLRYIGTGVGLNQRQEDNDLSLTGCGEEVSIQVNSPNVCPATDRVEQGGSCSGASR